MNKEVVNENLLCLVGGIMLAIIFLALMLGDLSKGWSSIF